MSEDVRESEDGEEYQPFLPGFGRWVDATPFEVWALAQGEVDLEERRAVYEELYGVEAASPANARADTPQTAAEDVVGNGEARNTTTEDLFDMVKVDRAGLASPAKGCTHG